MVKRRPTSAPQQRPRAEQDADDLEALTKVASMPGRTGPPPDWHAVEAALGVPLPADYKRLIDVHGEGILDHYFQVFGPSAHLAGYNLLEIGLDWDRDLHDDWNRYPDLIPERLRGRDVTIVNWGSTADATQFFWIAEQERPPEQWEIALLGHDSDDLEFHTCSTTALLAALVRGDLPTTKVPKFEASLPVEYGQYKGDVP